jgi:hypothetical protein
MQKRGRGDQYLGMVSEGSGMTVRNSVTRSEVKSVIMLGNREVARRRTIEAIAKELFDEANRLQERAKELRSKAHRMRELINDDRVENTPG